MAVGRVKFKTYSGQTLTAVLKPLQGSLGTPTPAGYLVDDTGDPSNYEFEIQGLVGEFDLVATDPEGEVAFSGYVDLLDTTATFRAYDYNAHAHEAVGILNVVAQDARLARQMLTNKHTIDPQNDGSVIIEVYEDTGQTIIKKVQYWTDGRREVVPL